MDRELWRAEGPDHPLGDRQGGQLHRAGRQRGAEKRGADAFISAYAKAPSPASSAARATALDKAFEMCPEG
jgi:hypothetical protein